MSDEKEAGKKARAKRAPSANVQLRNDVKLLKESHVETRAYLGKITDAINTLSTSVNDMVTSQAKNNPVTRNSENHSDDHQIGSEQPRALSSTGDASESLEERNIEPIEGATMAKAEALAFMEQEIEVVVADTTNNNDIAVPVVWNGGRAQYFIRNQKQTVKRKYVEILGRLKVTTYKQQITKDGNGNDTYINLPHTALMFPFSVVRDPAGRRGAEWLDKLLKESQ